MLLSSPGMHVRAACNIFTLAMLWIVAVYVNSLVWSPWHKLCNIWSNTFGNLRYDATYSNHRGRFEFFPVVLIMLLCYALNVYALSRGCCCNFTVYYLWQFNSIRISLSDEWMENKRVRTLRVEYVPSSSAVLQKKNALCPIVPQSLQWSETLLFSNTQDMD